MRAIIVVNVVGSVSKIFEIKVTVEYKPCILRTAIKKLMLKMS